MSTYRAWQPTLQPTALRGTWGEAWAVSLGTEKDALLALAKEAVRARLIDEAPSDALDLIGADRDLERGRSEADASWRDRIAGAWESWSWLGTRYGISDAVGLLGYGYPAVYSYNELLWDTASSRWSRITVIFRGLAAWDGSVVWDGAATWDEYRAEDGAETASADTIRPQLRRVIRKWMNARDICDRVLVTFGSLLWDIDILWDGEDTWDTGDGFTEWAAIEWDSSEDYAVWDSLTIAWDAFC